MFHVFLISVTVTLTDVQWCSVVTVSPYEKSQHFVLRQYMEINQHTISFIAVYSIKGTVGRTGASDWSCVGLDRYAPPTAWRTECPRRQYGSQAAAPEQRRKPYERTYGILALHAQ